MTKHHPAIARLRMAACRLWPDLTHAILSMTPVERRGLNTMAVDQHWRLYYDPAFLDSQEFSEDELTGIILHEMAHLLLKHHKRAKVIVADGQFQLWNIAADLAINDMLMKAGINLGPKALYPRTYRLPENKAAEFYYRELQKQQEKEEQDGQGESGEAEEGQDSGDDGDSDSSDSDSVADADDTQDSGGESEGDGSEEGQGDGQGEGDGEGSDGMGSGGEASGQGTGQGSEGQGQSEPCQPVAPGTGGSCADGQKRPWELGDPVDDCDGLEPYEQESIIRDTAEKIRTRGNNKGGVLQDYCNEILNPKVDPKQLIMAAIRKCTDDIQSGGDGKFSYRRPHRRPSLGGTIRPRVFSPTPRIKVLIDTSGSMQKKDIQLSVGLVAKCLNSLRLRDGIQVVTGDVGVAWAGKVFDHSKINLAGGGGTCMASIIASMLEEKIKPDLIIVCTDGETDWPTDKTTTPIVACVTRTSTWASKPPAWIKTVYLES